MKDENLLIEIEEMIGHLCNKNQVYTLSDDMKSSVTSAEKDIKNGNVFSEAESTYHFKQWFEKDNLVSNCYFGIRKYIGFLYSKKPV
ncbi:MAG: hypothetical protein IPN79_14010 [Saprospiraceae bacterium]|nr:hypothetical protein [Saprospiraceae bacterium]